MIRKSQIQGVHPTPFLEIPKEFSHSLSTEGSPRPAFHAHVSHKEKSQLCKKFVENGYCPYQGRCKFAHGLHQLKRNQQANCKYKTKQCGAFMDEGFCCYGNRCNFIHSVPETVRTQLRVFDGEMLQVKMLGKKGSRLLKLLQQ